MQRRQFFKRSLAATVAVGSAGWLTAEASSMAPSQECYELRNFLTPDQETQELMLRYLGDGLVPALNRLGINRIGVFTEFATPDKEASTTIRVLIPYTALDQFLDQRAALAGDKAYQEAAREYLARPKKQPAYTRINSYLMRAFAGMPVIEQPPYSVEKKPRIFELRIYQSHNEDMAARKVEMFNSGEIQTMRESGLGPVFFGEMLIGDNVPCLAYMLSAPDMEAHDKHWQTFRDHPDWKRIKVMPRYKGTVSHIDNYFMKPADCSQI